jgi:hypothetical protein
VLRPKLFALLVTLLFESAPARAQQASGTLTVNGASTPLTHVYAFWKDQAPFSTDLHLYVFLSDVALSDDALPRDEAANGRIAELVRSNKIHAFELHFADGGKTVSAGENGAIYHNGVAPARHGIVGFFTYEVVHLDGDMLEGRVKMEPDAPAQSPFKIDATFAVKVPAKR